MQYIIAPSLLAADFSAIGSEVAKVQNGGADWIHIDVMDGHFVPNISIGPIVLEWIRQTTELPLDVHLMIEHPERYIPQFLDAGADIITVHAEAIVEAKDRENRPNGAYINKNARIDMKLFENITQMVQNRGKRLAIAINPDTEVNVLENLIGQISMVLVMTVWPGFGGQSFMETTMNKVAHIRALSSDIDIEVDGGLSTQTVPIATQAGANVIVAGTTTFRDPDPAGAIQNLRNAIVHV